MTILPQFEQLLLVYAAYAIATASPGPSNMAIMGVAMSRGRAPAVVLAAGIVTGSLFWAILAATGISAILSAYAGALFALKIAGGLYLLYLAYKAARSALSAKEPQALSVADGARANYSAVYRRGVLLHLTNPKAILAWIAIMSLGLKPDASPYVLPAILAGCLMLGVIVFGGYALIFSTGPMIYAYQKSRRWIDGTLAVFFGFAGIRLLSSR
ncbi:amino acid transporter [Microvirga sp. KLBC 81]|uniref:LysE family translocator n=1 Tax=Microvirga sp. KLBC 81 TaxID=1862707 RepID=UPI000D518F0E|nr:LysE family translocator [Microvirga sp. KLBC 81]PVE25155.1 amino acid transporter [Microvirga sp. KLBC 81]